MVQQRFQDKYIRLGTLNTRYWQMGNQGSPVILIHGLGVSADIWMHNVAALAHDLPLYHL